MNDRLNRIGNRILRRYAGPVVRPLAHGLLHALVRVRCQRRQDVPTDAVGGFCGATALLGGFTPVVSTWLSVST